METWSTQSAVRLLRLQAARLSESHTCRGEWVGDYGAESKVEHDHLIQVANDLKREVADLVATRDELQGRWDYYQRFVQCHGADSITDLVVELNDSRVQCERWRKHNRRLEVVNGLLALALVVVTIALVASC